MINISNLKIDDVVKITTNDGISKTFKVIENHKDKVGLVDILKTCWFTENDTFNGLFKSIDDLKTSLINTKDMIQFKIIK